MTTTDETKLREMLDERGIPWRETISGHTGWETEHGDDAVTMGADAGLVLLRAWVTPEQAVAATLSSCNCSNNCTNSERTGTCHDVCNSVDEFTCSACGFNCDIMSWTSLFDGDFGRHRHHHHGTPNFCPNCGAKVVSE